ncbi:MAG: FCD domain-containing protein, partial [Pseudomonadota bacterium]
RLKPADRLPSERILAKRFNVGRPTVREAIRKLELIGLVEVFSGHKGTTIKNPEMDTYMESLREQMSWMIQIERTTLRQLAEVRDSLETRIALLAAERATKKQLKEMQTILDDMKSCTDDINAYLEKGIEFHSVMADATQNPIFFAIWNAFADLIFKYYRDLLKDLDKKILKKLYMVNVDVFEAILSKDPDQIHKAMLQHIKAEDEILWPK